MNSLVMRTGIASLLLGTLALLPYVAQRASTAQIAESGVLVPAPMEPELVLAANQREYVYYPGGGFYFAPRTRTWFWQEQGQWQHGLSLPEQFWDASGYGVNIVLESDLPYLEHEKVFAHYAELQQMLAYHQEATELGGAITR